MVHAGRNVAQWGYLSTKFMLPSPKIKLYMYKPANMKNNGKLSLRQTEAESFIALMWFYSFARDNWPVELSWSGLVISHDLIYFYTPAQRSWRGGYTGFTLFTLKYWICVTALIMLLTALLHYRVKLVQHPVQNVSSFTFRGEVPGTRMGLKQACFNMRIYKADLWWIWHVMTTANWRIYFYFFQSHWASEQLAIVAIGMNSSHVISRWELLLYPPLQRSWKGGILVSPCPSVRLSVCGQNRVRSVSSTILIGSISYLHIL